MTPHELRVALAREGAAITALPVDGLAAPVRGCPGWNVADLLDHLGGIHHWAGEYLRLGPDGGERTAAPPAPAGPARLDWYGERLAVLLAEFDRHDPDEPARTFVGPRTVGFWLRRQAHETAVHRWDGDDAVRPGAADPIDAALATDGIDEWLSIFVGRFLARGDGVPADLVGASLHLHCTDEGRAEGTGEWIMRLTETSVDVERAHAKGDAALRGPAHDLLLAAWHRLPLDRLDVVGDAALAARILDLVRVG